jgi:hypothetical protein
MSPSMRSLTGMNKKNLHKIVTAGEAFLVRQQSPDGFWRDYMLPPGPSEAWTTACVGWALANAPASGSSTTALRAAAAALHSVRATSGWGYSRNTATDADTTAWVCRLLALLDEQRGIAASACLQRYLNERGAARTFLSVERFGAWAYDHAEVTPLVGLALIAVGAEQSIINQVRQASLDARQRGGTWPSFWWSIDEYSTARNLEFLAASGGVPSEVSRSSWDWVSSLPMPSSPFEAAQRLMIGITLDMDRAAMCACLLEKLVAWQLADSSWPASSVLLLRQQWNGNLNEPLAYEDPMRLMSTATVIHVLKLLLL